MSSGFDYFYYQHVTRIITKFTFKIFECLIHLLIYSDEEEKVGEWEERVGKREERVRERERERVFWITTHITCPYII